MTSLYLSYGSGPDPDMKYLASEAEIKTIEETLEKGQAIVPEQAEKLLNWVVTKARHGLGAENLTAEKLTDACGIGQALTAYPLVAMGLPTKLLQLRDMPQRNNTHAVVATEIPVETLAGVEAKTFLVDISWRQYFSEKRRDVYREYPVSSISKMQYGYVDSILANPPPRDGTIDLRSLQQDIPEPGPVMLEELGAQIICDELLRKGFIDISDHAPGQAYFIANNSGIELDVLGHLNTCPSPEVDFAPKEIESQIGSKTTAGKHFPENIAALESGWNNASARLVPDIPKNRRYQPSLSAKPGVK